MESREFDEYRVIVEREYLFYPLSHGGAPKMNRETLIDIEVRASSPCKAVELAVADEKTEAEFIPFKAKVTGSAGVTFQFDITITRRKQKHDPHNEC